MDTRREAVANSSINRGRKLLRDTEKDLKDSNGKGCPVSNSLPWLLVWLAGVKLEELEKNGNGSDKIEYSGVLGNLKVTGIRTITMVSRLAVTGMVILILLHCIGIIKLPRFGTQLEPKQALAVEVSNVDSRRGGP